jgi:glycosyltransferase involved in cell wall biosynthesis
MLYVGRSGAEKGVDHLVQGFAAAMSSALIALLLIIGDGPVRTELESLARC